jgi:hypothetical protein
VDVTARRLGWSPDDGEPEYVSGELVILEAGEGGYAVHVVDGYTVDPESLEALRWAEQPPATSPEGLSTAAGAEAPSTSPGPGAPAAARSDAPAVSGDATTWRPPSSGPRQGPPATAR